MYIHICIYIYVYYMQVWALSFYSWERPHHCWRVFRCVRVCVFVCECVCARAREREIERERERARARACAHSIKD